MKSFTFWNYLLVMAFGQLPNRESLRYLMTIPNAHQSKFHHLGFSDNTNHNNSSKANKICEINISEDFANVLIQSARQRHSLAQDFFIDGIVYAFSLCPNTF
ncbi:DUF4372 domain-containing protein [uncultured Bacteroides sp.]|uniref:DUF4372 domain-containing protein n=1 Tax=uncultured Bacteroides sp. TaxID=162156 RepID=UPI0037489484